MKRCDCNDKFLGTVWLIQNKFMKNSIATLLNRTNSKTFELDIIRVRNYLNHLWRVQVTVNCALSLSRVYINHGYSLCCHSWQIIISKIFFNKCILHIFRVFQLSVWSASLHFELQQTTDISRDFSLRLSKRLADSDLAVIGRIEIVPIRKISVLDWFLPYWPNESFYIVLTDLII